MAFLEGKIYGITYASGTTQMSVVSLFSTSTPATLTQAMTNVKGITTDGVTLYAVEERTALAGASTNAIAAITSAGAVTLLSSAHLNMRSVVFDNVNSCLYISCPYDNKIVKAIGGGIAGNTETFNISDFITGITDQPGRLWIGKGSNELFMTTEANVKRIGAVTLTSGVAGTVNYIDIMQPVEETTCFAYFDEFDVFLYCGAGNRDAFTSASFFSFDPQLTHTTSMNQLVKLEDNSFIYADGTALRYCDISKRWT